MGYDKGGFMHDVGSWICRYGRLALPEIHMSERKFSRQREYVGIKKEKIE